MREQVSRRSVLSGLAAAGVGGSTGVAAGQRSTTEEWRHRRVDAGNTGAVTDGWAVRPTGVEWGHERLYSYSTIPDRSNARDTVRFFGAAREGITLAGPVVVGDRRAYFGSQGRVLLVDGEDVSVFGFDDEFTNKWYEPLRLRDGRLYAGVGNAVRAINISEGRVVWTALSSGEPVTHLAASSSRVVYGRSGELGALDPDGTVAWREPYNSGVRPDSLAVADGLVFVVKDGRFVVRSLADGAVQWTLAIPHGKGAVPAVAKGVVYLPTASGNGSIRALNTATGDQLWVLELPSPVFGPTFPTVVGGTVLFGAGDRLVAVDAASGERLWSFRVSGILNGRGIERFVPIPEGYIVDDGEYLYGLTRADDWRDPSDYVGSIAGGLLGLGAVGAAVRLTGGDVE